MNSVILMAVIILPTVTIARHNYMDHCVIPEDLVQPGFCFEKFLGRWFEQKWIPYDFVTEASRLRKVDVLLKQTYPNEALVTYRGRSFERGCNNREINFIRKTKTPGIFDMRIGDDSGGWFASVMNIVATNHVSYAVFYGCLKKRRDGTCALPDVWIFSRAPRISLHDKRIVDKVLRRLCVDQRLFKLSNVGKPCFSEEYKDELRDVLNNARW